MIIPYKEVHKLVPFLVKTKTKTLKLAYNAFSLCNKRHELAENFLSLILINLVPKVASNCE